MATRTVTFTRNPVTFTRDEDDLTIKWSIWTKLLITLAVLVAIAFGVYFYGRSCQLEGVLGQVQEPIKYGDPFADFKIPQRLIFTDAHGKTTRIPKGATATPTEDKNGTPVWKFRVDGDVILVPNIPDVGPPPSADEGE